MLRVERAKLFKPQLGYVPDLGLGLPRWATGLLLVGTVVAVGVGVGFATAGVHKAQ